MNCFAVEARGDRLGGPRDDCRVGGAWNRGRDRPVVLGGGDAVPLRDRAEGSFGVSFRACQCGAGCGRQRIRHVHCRVAAVRPAAVRRHVRLRPACLGIVHRGACAVQSVPRPQRLAQLQHLTAEHALAPPRPERCHGVGGEHSLARILRILGLFLSHCLGASPENAVFLIPAEIALWRPPMRSLRWYSLGTFSQIMTYVVHSGRGGLI